MARLDKRAEFLGDGLYVRMDDGMVTLTAPRANGDHWVALDYVPFRQFIRWCAADPGMRSVLKEEVEKAAR